MAKINYFDSTTTASSKHVRDLVTSKRQIGNILGKLRKVYSATDSKELRNGISKVVKDLSTAYNRF